MARTSSAPLYRILEARFRSAVARGDWPLGERIPTELELGRRHSASRHTVRQALGALVRDGILERRAGDGSYVRHVPAAQALAPWFSLTAELERRGLRAKARLIAREISVAGDRSDQLGIAEDALVHRITRRHDYRGRPIAGEVVMLPLGLLGEMEDHELEGSLHGLLLQRGLSPARARIDVQLGSSEEMPTDLRLAFAGTALPLARIERLSFLPDGTPLEHIVFWYPHDIEEWLLER